MVTLGVVLFLLIETRQLPRSFLLIMLGFTFLGAVKSKETGVCLIPLLWGSLWLGNEEKSWNRAARDAGLIATGFAIGLGGLMLLDHIFLGDALWGWRTTSLHRLVSFNIRPEIKRGSMNWYDVLFTRFDVAPPVLLSLFPFGRAESERDSSVVRYLWLVPLGLVIFLTDTMIRVHGVEPRYFTPALPLVSALAGHTINTRSDCRLGAISSALLLVFAGAVAVGTFRLIEKGVAAFGWQRDSFFKAILYVLTVLKANTPLLVYPPTQWKPRVLGHDVSSGGAGTNDGIAPPVARGSLTKKSTVDSAR